MYLALLLGFSNFILIAYNFVPEIKQMFNLVQFVIIFTLIYIPVTMLIGHYHIRKQLPTENAVTSEVHPYRDKLLPGKEELMTAYSKWNVEVAEQHMEALNWLLKAFNAPPELMFDKKLDEAQSWKERLKKLQRGQKASEIMQEESSSDVSKDSYIP
jgi:hypothetical protein